MAKSFNIKRLALASTAAAAILAAGVYGVNWWNHGRFQQSTDDAYLQADSTIVAPKVSGYVQDVLVNDNEQVAAGQILARIDPRDFQTSLAQAQAVAEAQQAISNLDAQIALQRTLVAENEADIGSAQAALAFAQQNFGRYSVLAHDGFGTVERAQQASADLTEANAALIHDRASRLAAQLQIAVLQTGRARTEAELQHGQAVERQAELNLSYTTIIAPIAGTIGARSLRQGQYVQAGTELMALVPLDDVYVVANIKETQLGAVVPRQPVEVRVDRFPGQLVHGHVDSLAPASGQEFALLPPDNATGNFTKVVQRIPVKIAIDGGASLIGQLLPGMSVEATIDTKAEVIAQATANQQIAAR